MKESQLDVVLCWHMHQPNYKDGQDGTYHLPWVYLHAIKDYTDMAAYLEKSADHKAVVNFTPVLLEQLDEYARVIKAWLDHGYLMNDPLLNLLAGASGIPSDHQGRADIISICRRAHTPTMINTLPAFERLYNTSLTFVSIDNQSVANCEYLNEQYFVDLLMWYHIAWMGSSVRHGDARLRKLMNQGGQYSASDRRLMLSVIADCIEGIIPRYKALQDSGQVELSMTPHSHPIVPLLIDFESMRDCQPNDPGPGYNHYPDGYNRSRWHMEKGLEVFQHYFGKKPSGVWLSEGGVSLQALDLLDEYGIGWSASGEGVWRHSNQASGIDVGSITSKHTLYQANQIDEKNCLMFFRDDGLSDLIGFQYKDWSPEDAVNNFIHHLENIHTQVTTDEDKRYIVPIILDGENAWEYYHANASEFLPLLYKKIARHPLLNLTTFKDSLAGGVSQTKLPTLAAGSWVFGTFSTWIGQKDKNLGWDLLVEAKQAYDQLIATNDLDEEYLNQITQQLAICEGSDWFWWFGDYNPADSVQDFDQLYRRHLSKLYQLMKVEPPESLNKVLSYGGAFADQGGTMRQNA